MTDRKTMLWCVLKYGILLFAIAMIGLFVMSVILQSEQPIDRSITGVAVAALESVAAYWFARRVKPETAREALLYGVGWMLVVAGILLAIAIPNHTTSIVFGNGSTYLIFLVIPAAAWLAKSN